MLCNCGIEVENSFLLESITTCHDANTNLVMYFTVNTAFTSYIDQFQNIPYQYFLTIADLMILYLPLLKH